LYDSPSGFLKAIRGNYDLVIDTEQWHRLSAVVARLIKAPVSIGYATNARSKMFTHSVGYSHDDYEAESFFRLSALLEIGPVHIPERFLVLTDAAVTYAAKFLEPVAEKPFVAIFPGASIPERRWGTDRFRMVAELLSAFGIATVVIGGKEDRELGDSIVAGGRGLNLAGMTSLAETAAVIDKSALLISGDSGVLHIAVGLGKPTVSLFGPGRAKKWAPRGERHVVINKELPCSPCTTFGTTPPCPVDAKCMKEISVDEVFNAVAVLLTSTGILPSSCCKRDWVEVAEL
jgi:ADP-heptose:LPS heptosyltransferase